MSEQLLESVAASQAIEDAIYVLNKGAFVVRSARDMADTRTALTSDDVKLDVETFAKEVTLCAAVGRWWVV